MLLPYPTIEKVEKGDVLGQVKFIHQLFGVAA